MKPMRMGIDRKLTTGCVLLFCLCSADTVLGQGHGDYDGDYDVDASDFANWGGCMTGEFGGPVPPFDACNAFDFDDDACPGPGSGTDSDPFVALSWPVVPAG